MHTADSTCVSPAASGARCGSAERAGGPQSEARAPTFGATRVGLPCGAFRDAWDGAEDLSRSVRFARVGFVNGEDLYPNDSRVHVSDLDGSSTEADDQSSLLGGLDER